MSGQVVFYAIMSWYIGQIAAPDEGGALPFTFVVSPQYWSGKNLVERSNSTQLVSMVMLGVFLGVLWMWPLEASTTFLWVFVPSWCLIGKNLFVRTTVELALLLMPGLTFTFFAAVLWK